MRGTYISISVCILAVWSLPRARLYEAGLSPSVNQSVSRLSVQSIGLGGFLLAEFWEK